MAKTTKKAPQQKTVSNVRVKPANEVVATVQRHIEYNLHSRYNLSFSKATQKKLVAYGPWLAIGLIVFIIPQLMALAKTGSLMTFSGFFNTVFFNQDSWVILLIIFTNILLLVDGVSKIFEKGIAGWTRVYQAMVISTGYIVWQLLSNISEPAAPILALLGAVLVLFALFDIKQYYR
jgi:hypothetical protein